MPATAAHLGLAEDKIFDGYENIAAAARYLRELDGHFSDIRSGQERIKFVLAAYNGGPGHVRDAMALTRKYGRNPHLWSEVSEYLLKLSNAKYYRDPLVKYGYMISSGTGGGHMAEELAALGRRWKLSKSRRCLRILIALTGRTDTRRELEFMGRTIRSLIV